jgi:hypothetical protein
MTNVVVVDGRFETEPAKVVYKFMLDLNPDPILLPVPRGARLLHAEFFPGNYPLEGQWLLWYEVDLHLQGDEINHIYHTIATGTPIPKCLKHLATGWRKSANSWRPAEVWHLYEYPSGAKVVDV